MDRIDPFTKTPGVAGAAYIDMHYTDEINMNFQSELSSKYVYKIVGLRGSGKSVEYRNVINTFSGKPGWLVYTLSAAGDPVATLIAKLSKESFIDAERHTTATTFGGSAAANALIINGSANVSVTKTAEANPKYDSPEATLDEMVQRANDNGYRILVGIDDISKTPEMVKFLSIWGAMLLEDQKKIYLVCTGLAKNIEDFATEPSLTFFKRSDLVEIGPLDKFAIASMYQKLLSIDEMEAVKLAKFTKGYAYAYQVLGSLYFKKREEEKFEDLIPEFDKTLFRDSYDLIWRSLTNAEKEMVKGIVYSENGKTSEIKSFMNTPASYDTLRARLENKHLINTEQRGVLRIDLPRFDQYVKLWHSDEV